ncbi:hypothetical protein ACH5RR_018770 [Cinchona calisaya]|uniref:Uncharacterized protein n=1 Tax=Cinchona calisaya TaxID=153742 RepID=A0ABD2ZMJ5_9GENT
MRKEKSVKGCRILKMKETWLGSKARGEPSRCQIAHDIRSSIGACFSRFYLQLPEIVSELLQFFSALSVEPQFFDLHYFVSSHESSKSLGAFPLSYAGFGAHCSAIHFL